MVGSLWRWLQGQLVQTVPDSIAVCEFDCRALACRRGEWERCERRLRDSTDGRRHRMPWPTHLDPGVARPGVRGRA
jgi:hypothetical protein